MKIVVNEDYYLVQDSNKFDLYWTKEVNKRKFQTGEDGSRSRIQTEERGRTLICLGYSMTLENCINKIIKNNLSNRDEEISLKQWLELYKEETKKFSELFKNLKLN